MVGTEPKKGVSPVIASVLMVVIAIVLVGYAYTVFSGMARKAGATGTKAVGEMEKSMQKLEIVTVIYNVSNHKLCFRLKAPGSNTLAIPLKDDGTDHVIYLVDGREVSLLGDLSGCAISGTPLCNQSNLTLVPGDSCYGAVTWTGGYPYLFEIQHDWGAYDAESLIYTS